MWSYILTKSDLIIKFRIVTLSDIIQIFNPYHMSCRRYIFYYVFIKK